MQPGEENGQNVWQPQEEEGNINAQDAASQNLAIQETEAATQVEWDASESIAHEYDVMWFLGFGSIFLIFIGISIWLQQWTFTVLLVVMAVSLIVYINRPSRVLHYGLNDTGLTIDNDFHEFTEFRSFGVLQHGALFSIVLMPTKRFGQATTVYIAESDGEMIVDILGSRLPMEDMKFDLLDNLLRRLRL